MYLVNISIKNYGKIFNIRIIKFDAITEKAIDLMHC